MSMKDYKKGAEDVAKPAIQSFTSLINQTQDLINEMNSKFTVMNNVTMDILSDSERKRLYDLNTPFDIKQLDDDEKAFVAAVLYQLASEFNGPSIAQQDYLRSIQNYLEVRNPQLEMDIFAIENIKDMDSQKAIFQVVVEYLFLKNEKHEYLQKHKEFIEHFNLNEKNKSKIYECVDNIYKATGIRGLSERYGYVPSGERMASKTKGEFACIKDIMEQWKQRSWMNYEVLFLFPEQSELYSWDDLPSMSQCKKIAESRLSDVYNCAKSYISPFGNKSIVTLTINAFSDQIENDFNAIKHSFRLINKERNNNDLLKEIEELLDLDAFKSKLRKSLENEIISNPLKYEFQTLSYFQSKIEYSDHDAFSDMGAGMTFLAKTLQAVAKKGEYSFDGMEAWVEIDSLVTGKLRSFEVEASSIIMTMLSDKYAMLIEQKIIEIEHMS